MMNPSSVRSAAALRRLCFGWLFAGLSSSVALATYSATVYVSPTGDDTWDGLSATHTTGLHGPCYSISAALTAAEGARTSADGFLVRVFPGYYTLNKPITITKADSGSAAVPTVIGATATNTAVMSGAVDISPTAWSLRSGTGIYEAVVPASYPSGQVPTQMFVSSSTGSTPGTNAFERRFRPRYPTTGYLQVYKPLPEPSKRDLGLVYDPSTFPTGRIEPKTMGNGNPTELVLFHSWSASNHVIDSVYPGVNEVTFTQNCRYDVGHFENNQRYYLDNVTADDTQLLPGQWEYIPAVAGGSPAMIRYYPLSTESITSLIVHLPAVARMVFFAGAARDSSTTISYITIDNIDFRYADRGVPEDAMAKDSLSNTWPYGDLKNVGTSSSPVWTPYLLSDGSYDGFGAAIFGDGLQNVVIEHCEVGGVGAHGIRFLGGTSHVQINNNWIHDLGAGGVLLGDMSAVNDQTAFWHTGASADYIPVIADQNMIYSNLINDGSKIFPTGTGVVVGHASNTQVAHNRIANFNYSAIAMGRVTSYQQYSYNYNNIIEYNHLSNIGNRMLSDGGAIYYLGQTQMVTSVPMGSPAVGTSSIITNWIDKTAGYRITSKIAGIYLDEGSSDLVVNQNVITYSEQAAFTFHYGSNNMVENNLFYAGGWDPIQIAAETDRGLFDLPACESSADNAKHFDSTVNFHNNVLVLTGYGADQGQQIIPSTLRAVFATSCIGAVPDTANPDGTNPTPFQADHNLYWSDSGAAPIMNYTPGANQATWSQWQGLPQDLHSTNTSDPGAVADSGTGWASVTNTYGYATLMTTQPGLVSGTWLDTPAASIVEYPLGARVSDLGWPLTYSDSFDTETVGDYPNDATSVGDTNHGATNPSDRYIAVVPGPSGSMGFSGPDVLQLRPPSCSLDHPVVEYQTNLDTTTRAALISFKVYVPGTGGAGLIVSGTYSGTPGAAVPFFKIVQDGTVFKGYINPGTDEHNTLHTGNVAVGYVPTNQWATVQFWIYPPGMTGSPRVGATINGASPVTTSTAGNLTGYQNLNLIKIAATGDATDSIMIDDLSINYAP